MNQWYVYDFITRRWSSNQDQSGDFTVKQGATTIHEDSAVYTVSSSSWTMEVAAVTRWIASNGEHATILTNLSACYEKWKMGWEVYNGMCQCSTSTFEYRWHVSMFNIHLWIQMWICCSGHAGFKGYDRAERLICKSNCHKWLASRKIWHAAGKRPVTWHHRSPGGERRGKRKC